MYATEEPSEQPTVIPSEEPSDQPTEEPSEQPSQEPTGVFHLETRNTRHESDC